MSNGDEREEKRDDATEPVTPGRLTGSPSKVPTRRREDIEESRREDQNR